MYFSCMHAIIIYELIVTMAARNAAITTLCRFFLRLKSLLVPLLTVIFTCSPDKNGKSTYMTKRIVKLKLRIKGFWGPLL